MALEGPKETQWGVDGPCGAGSLVGFSELNSTTKSLDNGTFKYSDFNNITHFTLIHTVTM